MTTATDPMHRAKRTNERLRLTALILLLGLVGGCTERLDGFEARFDWARGGPPRGETIVLTVPQRQQSRSPDPVHVRPHEALLRLNGYLPVRPTRVTESGGSFLVEFRLPDDLVRLMRSYSMGAPSIQGELILPLETSVTSFAGVEHFIPSTTFLSGDVTAVYSGPFNRMGKAIAEFLRGLYAAR